MGMSKFVIIKHPAVWEWHFVFSVLLASVAFEVESAEYFVVVVVDVCVFFSKTCMGEWDKRNTVNEKKVKMCETWNLVVKPKNANFAFEGRC